jgi:hypothetical protein
LLPHAKEHLSIVGGLRADFHIHNCRTNRWWWSSGRRNSGRRGDSGRQRRRKNRNGRLSGHHCPCDDYARASGDNDAHADGRNRCARPNSKHDSGAKRFSNSADRGEPGTTRRRGAGHFGHNDQRTELGRHSWPGCGNNNASRRNDGGHDHDGSRNGCDNSANSGFI